MRMARQLSRNQTREDMIAILEEISEVLPKDCDSCFHGKDFYHTLYDMDELPLTQTQS